MLREPGRHLDSPGRHFASRSTENDNVIHIPKLQRDLQISDRVVIEAVEIKIGEQLAGQIADR